MEDLVPFLIFIVIALANLVKFVVEKGGKKKAPTPAAAGKPKHRPSGLEAFFTELAEKLEPQPTPLPDWPEGRPRPDYRQEMEAFETARFKFYEEEEEPERIVTMPAPEPAPVRAVRQAAAADMRRLDQVKSLKTALKAMPATFFNSRGMRIASPPLLRSAGGRIEFELKEKSMLRQAIIANVIFSPPRAYDVSFDNTILK